MEKKLLKIGDILYPKNVYGILEPIIIDKVTSTQAHCTSCNKKFRIEYLYDASLIGASYSFGTMRYYLETPELKQELLRAKILHNIAIFNFKNLTNEQLHVINEILTNK